MREKGQNSYCPNCERWNTVLDHICCKCGWHLLEQRQAIEEEAKPVLEKLDQAIAQMKQEMRRWK